LQAAFPEVTIQLRGDAGFALPLLYKSAMLVLLSLFFISFVSSSTSNTPLASRPTAFFNNAPNRCKSS